MTGFVADCHGDEIAALNEGRDISPINELVELINEPQKLERGDSVGLFRLQAKQPQAAAAPAAAAPAAAAAAAAAAAPAAATAAAAEKEEEMPLHAVLEVEL